MRIYTKVIPILLVISMILAALAGCASGDPKDTPAATTPAETPTATPEVTPDETPAESPAEPQEELYNITYELGGGFGPTNPTKYSESDEFTLAAPLRPGYLFAGWTGTDLTAPTMSVTIPKGTNGDRSYTANWEVMKDSGESDRPTELDKTHFGKDDGIGVSGFNSLSETVIVGDRAQGIHLTNTVYTTIVTDGVMDAAYTYGLHFRMDLIDTNKEYYANRATTFDVYIVRGQEGMLHVYINVVDPEICVPEELWATKNWRTDCLHFYYDYGATGTTHKVWTFGADGDPSHVLTDVDEWKYTKTITGFAYEFAFDNNGVPFMDGDELGFGVYYNDCNEYVSLDNYKKSTLRIPSRINKAGGSYAAPNAATHDVLLMSVDSATGVIENVKPTVEKTGDMLADIISGASKTVVAYSSTCSPHTRYQAEAIYSELLLGGANVQIMPEHTIKRSHNFEYKIFIGTVPTDEFEQTMEVFGYGDCGFSIIDNTISVIGWVEQSLYDARKMLEAAFDYAAHGGSSKVLGSFYAVEHSATAGNSLPKIEGVDLITDAGDGAYMLLVRPATMDEFNKIRTDLAAAGFKLHAENTMNTVLCATYYDETAVVNVTYDSSELNKRDIRIVVEPLSGTALPATQPEAYTPTATPSVTQLAPNNLTLIYKLENGEFLIIDSGSRGHHTYIYNELMKLADSDKPVVAAWIFTHFHQDHIGGFIDFANDGNTCLKDVTVKNIIFNFPEKQVLDTASSGDQVNLGLWPQCLRNTGATIYQARTGQKYYFAGAEVEILFTYEDLMPFFVEHDRTNPTSMIFTVKIKDQLFNITGDASSEATKLCAERYEDYLKADFSQHSHHGAGDGGTARLFYMHIDAPYVFIPGSAAHGAAEKWACENALEKGGKVFIRDTVGTVTLEIPYSGE